MANIKIAHQVDIEEVYAGDLLLIGDEATNALVNWCIKCINDHLGEIASCDNIFQFDKDLFVRQATACKKFFTNADQTKDHLENLISQRYCNYKGYDLFYDVPRVRIIPNSDYLMSGISYNYQPHRDTWYGAGQEQINHWISVINVTPRSTFFIAPQFFNSQVRNSSEMFDLDEWDLKHRPLASSANNLNTEQRPHPLPEDPISPGSKIGFPLSSGNEICFSGHHLHGSLKNDTSKIRISIDYRVCCEVPGLMPPKNVDNKASGNYKKYLVKHSRFGN